MENDDMEEDDAMSDSSYVSSNLSVYNRMGWEEWAIYVHHRLYLDLTSVRAAFGAWALLLILPGVADSDDELFIVC